jgi:predicted transcriptional regulator
MADLSITAANVVAGNGASIVNGTAGATITAGQVVYKDVADGRYKLADANASAATAEAVGIALHAASNGQPLAILSQGTLTPGATVVVGTVYVASATPGGIAPAADLTTGWRTTVLGVGITAATIAVDIQVSGVAVP